MSHLLSGILYLRANCNSLFRISVLFKWTDQTAEFRVFWQVHLLHVRVRSTFGPCLLIHRSSRPFLPSNCWHPSFLPSLLNIPQSLGCPRENTRRVSQPLLRSKLLCSPTAGPEHLCCLGLCHCLNKLLSTPEPPHVTRIVQTVS